MEPSRISTDEWLFRYFSGHLAPEEEEELLAWLEADAANRAALAAAADRWALLHTPRFAARRERNFKTRFEPLLRQAGGRRGRSLRAVWMAAAAVALLLAVGAGAYRAGRQAAGEAESGLIAAAFEASTPLGSTSRLVLPDGTVVWLNAGSTLRYCPAAEAGGDMQTVKEKASYEGKTAYAGKAAYAGNVYTGKASSAGKASYAEKISSSGNITCVREVTLSGEAYFEVAPDSLRPFIVKSEKLRVRVTGTRFDVRAYPDEETVDVALASGKVFVRLDEGGEEGASAGGAAGIASAGKPVAAGAAAAGKRAVHKEVELAPERMLSYNKETNCVNLSRIAASDVFAWTDGRLRFHARPFTRIAKDLERKFNVSISVRSEALRREVFTGSFPATSTLDEILSEIDVEHKYRWRREKGVVVIRDREAR